MSSRTTKDNPARSLKLTAVWLAWGKKRSKLTKRCSPPSGWLIKSGPVKSVVVKTIPSRSSVSSSGTRSGSTKRSSTWWLNSGAPASRFKIISGPGTTAPIVRAWFWATKFCTRLTISSWRLSTAAASFAASSPAAVNSRRLGWRSKSLTPNPSSNFCIPRVTVGWVTARWAAVFFRVPIRWKVTNSSSK